MTDGITTEEVTTTPSLNLEDISTYKFIMTATYSVDAAMRAIDVKPDSYWFARAFAKIAEEGDVAKYGDTFAVEVGQPLVGWELGHPGSDPEVLYVTCLEAKGAANTKLCEWVAEYRAGEVEQGEWARAALINDGFSVVEEGGN